MKVLLELKAEYKKLTGEDVPPTGAGAKPKKVCRTSNKTQKFTIQT